MELNLEQEKSIEIIEKESETIITDKVILSHFVDSPSGKTVVATIVVGGFPKQLTLWSGDKYDTAGDYKQSDVNAKIIELLTK